MQTTTDLASRHPLGGLFGAPSQRVPHRAARATTRTLIAAAVALCAGSAHAQNSNQAQNNDTIAERTIASGDQLAPGLTIYNGGFGVVRHRFPVELGQGFTQLSFAGATKGVEAPSVILRDIRGNARFTIYEQSYRNDPVSESRLLEHFEGEAIDFLVSDGDDTSIVTGTIVRSGFKNRTQPIIDIDGRVQFGLPGQPLFPSIGDGSLLEPTLTWLVGADAPTRFVAELAYVSSGMNWKADYNIVAPPADDAEPTKEVSLMGWVTVDNNTGQTFENATLSLLAGDVNRVRDVNRGRGDEELLQMAVAARSADAVQEKTIDEYHLYTINRPTTLFDAETKQVEFVRAEAVESTTEYEFDAWRSTPRAGGEGSTVSVVRVFDNTEDNGLGMALPAGKVRFYQQDDSGTLEFVGENTIGHTPEGETIRLYTGNAFDLTAERTITESSNDSRAKRRTESFEVELRNAKTQPVTIKVIEHVGRNWRVLRESHEHEQRDAFTITYDVRVPAKGEATVSFTIEHQW